MTIQPPANPASWWTIVGVISTAFASVVGATVAFIGVGRRKAGEHMDVVCNRRGRAFDYAFEGVLIVNREGRIVDSNRQAGSMTGWAFELVGRSIYDLIPARHHDAHRKHVQRYINDPQPRRMGDRHMDIVMVDRYQIEKAMQISLVATPNEFGEMEIIVGMRVVQGE